jgi:hypothetical protein
MRKLAHNNCSFFKRTQCVTPASLTQPCAYPPSQRSNFK